MRTLLKDRRRRLAVALGAAALGALTLAVCWPPMVDARDRLAALGVLAGLALLALAVVAAPPRKRGRPPRFRPHTASYAARNLSVACIAVSPVLLWGSLPRALGASPGLGPRQHAFELLMCLTGLGVLACGAFMAAYLARRTPSRLAALKASVAVSAGASAAGSALALASVGVTGLEVVAASLVLYAVFWVLATRRLAVGDESPLFGRGEPAGQGPAGQWDSGWKGHAMVWIVIFALLALVMLLGVPDEWPERMPHRRYGAFRPRAAAIELVVPGGEAPWGGGA